MSKDDFFEIAEICTGTDTTHSVHFMNWQGHVFGTSLLDYPDKSDVYRELKKTMMQRYEEVKKDRPYLRQDQYLLYYMNAADYMLSARYRRNFVEYFTAGRRVEVGEPTSEEFHPFERCNSCFFLSFKFKN